MKYKVMFAHAIRPTLIRFIVTEENMTNCGYSVVVDITNKTTDHIKRDIAALISELHLAHSMAELIVGADIEIKDTDVSTDANRESHR